MFPLNFPLSLPCDPFESNSPHPPPCHSALFRIAPPPHCFLVILSSGQLVDPRIVLLSPTALFSCTFIVLDLLTHMDHGYPA